MRTIAFSFTIRGRFSKKCKKCSQNSQVLRLQAVITPQWLQIALNSRPNWPSTGCLVSILPLESIQSLSSGLYVPYKKGTYTHIFRNVRCPILRVETDSMPQCWCCLATDIWKKSRLNYWKLKINNVADNADISQARDTRHRRMLEVDSLCTDSGPLQGNTVLCLSTQYSFLVRICVVCWFLCVLESRYVFVLVETMHLSNFIYAEWHWLLISITPRTTFEVPAKPRLHQPQCRIHRQHCGSYVRLCRSNIRLFDIVAVFGNNVVQFVSTLSKGQNFVRHCRQRCRSNIRHCRKNRSTCSARQCCLDIVAGVDGA